MVCGSRERVARSFGEALVVRAAPARAEKMPKETSGRRMEMRSLRVKSQMVFMW